MTGKATGSSLEKPSYAISHGFLGGPLASRRFRKHMKAAGYRPTELSQADVVIAHSAGCWRLADIRPRLLMIVGLPLAKPGPRTSFRANLRRSRAYLANRHVWRGVNMTLSNLYYGLTQPRHNLSLIRNAAALQAGMAVPNAGKLLFVINRDDPWPGNAANLSRYLKQSGWCFVGLAGSHDDIWENPEPYIQLINDHARVLAKTD